MVFEVMSFFLNIVVVLAPARAIFRSHPLHLLVLAALPAWSKNFMVKSDTSVNRATVAVISLVGSVIYTTKRTQHSMILDVSGKKRHVVQSI